MGLYQVDYILEQFVPLKNDKILYCYVQQFLKENLENFKQEYFGLWHLNS